MVSKEKFMGKRVRPVAIIRRAPLVLVSKRENRGNGARQGLVPNGWKLETVGIDSMFLVDPSGEYHRANFDGYRFVVCSAD